MIVGYARTSTVEQEAGLEAQRRDLAAHGVEKLYAEQVSSVGQRDQLEAALDWVRQNDVFVITRLDRLARNVSGLLQIVERLTAKGVSLRILDLNIDTATATGKLTLSLLGAIAEFERALMLERQAEGIMRAKAAGKFKGRAPTARRQADKVRELAAEGISARDIAIRTGISRASVYRLLSDSTCARASD